MLGLWGLLHEGGQQTRWLLGLGRCSWFFCSNSAGFISSVGHHEPVDERGLKTCDMHRAIVSLTEKEHAVMVLE
jgi:hypothetical protein